MVDNPVISSHRRSIILKSNINLDLNGSIIQLEENSETHYEIISIYSVYNSSVCNGILIGDRYKHNYIENSSNQWGMGIGIKGSENINISNLKIFDTIGDGIYLTKVGQKPSINIDISNCNIYNTRRQGITIITAQNVNIYNDEIHNIIGSHPQSGIDLEKNEDTEIIKNIYIYNNKFYNCASNKAIQIYSHVENVYIDDNEIYGDIYIEKKNNLGNNTIHIGNNTFKVAKQDDYSKLNTNLTNTFTDINLRNAILELVGKEENDKILESDIAKIASDNVPGGKQLNLVNKGISNLNGIEIFAKYNLEWLYLDNNNITDLSPILSLTSLTKLNASNNKISDISALKNLTNLNTINLTNNNISDISVLNNKNNLEYLYLNNNKISSLDSLSNINTIKEIYCAENEIEIIDNIIKISNLEKLDVRKNKIKNVLTKLISNKLNYLNLSDNKLLDISGIEKNNIENLNIKNQNIELGIANINENKYVQINLPQIFNMIDDTYKVEVKNIPNYEFKNNYNSIIIYSNDFINNGLNIIVSKDNNVYLNYLIEINNSIKEEISKKFNMVKTQDGLRYIRNRYKLQYC